MNSLQVALVNAGLAKEPKEKKRKPRKFTCKKCGGDMYPIEGTNTMACTECDNYFIFTKGQNEY